MKLEAHEYAVRPCPQCAFPIFPRMEAFDQAAHAVHHRRADHIAARLRNVPITRTELEEYLALLDRYVNALERRCSEYRGVIADLSDALADAGTAELVADVVAEELEP